MIRMVALKKDGLRYGGTGHPVIPVGMVFHAKTAADAKTLRAFKWARDEPEPAPAPVAEAPKRPSYYARDMTAETEKVVAAKRKYTRRDLTAEGSDS